MQGNRRKQDTQDNYVQQNSNHRVLITARSFRSRKGRHWDIITDSGFKIIESPYDRPLTEEEMCELIRGVSGLIVGLDPVTEKVVNCADKLRIIAKHGVGVDNIDIRAAAERGIIVSNTPGGNDVSVAELAFALMLGLARALPWHDSIVKMGQWSRSIGVELCGKTLGIVGLGRVGKALAERAKAFGMVLLAVEPAPDTEFCRGLGIRLVSLGELLRESDFVSLHVPLVPSTKGMIGEPELRTMKPTAFIINTSRGGIVDEDALAKALNNGWIAGAALDAFSEEPPLGNPLLSCDNVILTPHIGANTKDAVERMGLIAATAVVDVLSGRVPDSKFVVNH